MKFDVVTACVLFQSTLSVRRATFDVSTFPAPHTFQSTLSVRRATGADYEASNRRQISIHALREESVDSMFCNMPRFNISIHALREESDVVFVDFVGCVVDFNPRSP